MNTARPLRHEMPSRSRAGERGFTFLEIMISMAMFSVGALGVVAMQVVAVNSNRFSAQMSQCLLLAEDQLNVLNSTPWDSALLADSSSSDEASSTEFKRAPGDDPDPSTVADAATAVQSINIGGTVDATFDATSRYQRYWQIDDVETNSTLNGTLPDLKRIRVSCRFYDSSINQWREVSLTSIRASVYRGI